MKWGERLTKEEKKILDEIFCFDPIWALAAGQNGRRRCWWGSLHTRKRLAMGSSRVDGLPGGKGRARREEAISGGAHWMQSSWDESAGPKWAVFRATARHGVCK